MYSIDVKTLADVLSDIKAVANHNDLKYQLETKFKDGTGARVIIRYVKPFNGIIYTHMLMGDISNSPKGLADVIEEEVVIEITTDGDKWAGEWNWTKHLTKKETDKVSVLRSSILEIQDALKGTDWKPAHRHLIGIPERHKEVIKYWNRGKGHEEIAKLTKYKQSYVAKLISEFRKEFPRCVTIEEQHRQT